MGTNPDSDAVLIRQFAVHDSPAAFRLLVERHGGWVLACCRRYFQDVADAEDAAQAAFVALALKARRLDSRPSVAGWLHKVARQICLDMLRSAERRRRREEEAARRRELNDAAEHGALLDEALAKLSAPHREVLIRHYFEGVKVEAIAAAEACSTSAITMRLTRAREKLRDQLRKTSVASALILGIEGISQAAPVPLEFVDGTVRVAAAAMQGVVAAGKGAVMELARQALGRIFFHQVRWAMAGSLGAIAVAGVVAIAQESPEPAPEPGAASGSAISPQPGATAEPTPTPHPEPRLITEIRKPLSWEKLPQFKRVLDETAEPLDFIRDAHGLTPLHWAARGGNEEPALMFLLRGARTNVVDNQGETPLFPALQNRRTWMTLLFILAGADVNHVSTSGLTPLGVCVRNGDARHAELLLWLGAKTRVQGVPDAMQPATLAGNDGALRELLAAYDSEQNPTFASAPRRVPLFVKNALHDAAKVGDFDRLQAFIEAGVNVNLPDDHGKTALHRAIMAGQPEVVFYLLFIGANPNAKDSKGFTPLMETMVWLGGGLDAMRRFVIVRGASPYTVRPDGHTELTWAAYRGNEHSVQWLLWMGVNGRERSVKHGSPFQIAFRAGSQSVLDVFRRNGIDEPFEWSADQAWNLNIAAKLGDRAMLEKLLAEGAPVDAPGADGNSPLMSAILGRKTGIGKLLLGHGAQVDYRNPKSGWTPLFMTIIWDYGQMSQFRRELLEAGADPNVVAQNGDTPLFRALWYQPTEALRQLIEFGADLNARDAKGRTPLTRALQEGKRETAEFLRQQGATE